MPTQDDVVTRAFRILGVKAEDEGLTADQLENGRVVLDSLFSELKNEEPFTWLIDVTPSVSFQPLSVLLAVELAPEYSVQRPTTRGMAWRRFMATVRSDNREDPRDADEDGIISAEEADAGLRATYY